MTLQAPAPTVTAPPDEDNLGWALWWIRENGHMYLAVRDELDDGFRMYPDAPTSVDSAFHTVRFRRRINSRGDMFSLNNNATALCARLYLHERKQHADKIATRRSWLDDLSPADWSSLTFAASRIKAPPNLGPLFGGRA